MIHIINILIFCTKLFVCELHGNNLKLESCRKFIQSSIGSLDMIVASVASDDVALINTKK